ncbi:hypothetical protein JHK87_035103 [Glycine soja]|nr:hypothetical protein JHK87_035103 [Glycine soja]
MLDPRRDQPTISFPLSNEIGHITHGYDTWGATNTDFMASKKRPKNYKICHSYNNDMEVQLGTGSKVDDDESGICSPPLWTTSPPKSPHQCKNHYRCLSPASKTQAIARGQRELMEMVKSMPESSYELSLKDLVEHPRVEVAQEKGAEERKNLGDKNVDSRKKVDMNIKKGQVKRSGNIDSGGFYLKMVFPISLGSKKKTKNESLVNSGSNKVSPRTSVSDHGSKSLDKEWWKKKSLSGSGGESDSGVSSINSGSMKSSGSNNSSSSSRSNSSKPQASSPGRRWVAIHRIHAEFPSHHILPFDLCLFPSITFIAKVRDKELDHPFLLTFYATINTAKGLRFRNTNLHLRTSYFPSPILIWDPDSTFEAMV